MAFKKKTMRVIAEWLLVVGGLNWGFGLFKFNLVTWLGELIKYVDIVNWVVYGAVFVSAIYMAYKYVSK